nr:hypothetical protein [Pseudomonas alcaliphila]
MVLKPASQTPFSASAF